MINKAKLIPILFIAPLFLMGTKISNSDKNHVLYNDYEIVNFELSDLDENNYRTLTFDINNTGEGIITLQQSYITISNTQQVLDFEDLLQIATEEEYYETLGKRTLYIVPEASETFTVKQAFASEFSLEDFDAEIYAYFDFITIEHTPFTMEKGGVDSFGNYWYEFSSQAYEFDQSFHDILICDVSIKDNSYYFYTRLFLGDGGRDLSFEYCSKDSTLVAEDFVVNTVYGIHIEVIEMGPCIRGFGFNIDQLIIGIFITCGVLVIAGALTPVVIYATKKIKNRKTKKEA